MSKKRSNRNSRKVLKALKQKRANSARTGLAHGGKPVRRNFSTNEEFQAAMQAWQAGHDTAKKEKKPPTPTEKEKRLDRTAKRTEQMVKGDLKDAPKAEVAKTDPNIVTKQKDIQKIADRKETDRPDDITTDAITTTTADVTTAKPVEKFDAATYTATKAEDLDATKAAQGTVSREAEAFEATLTERATAAERDEAQEKLALAKEQDNFEISDGAYVDKVTGEKTDVAPTKEAERIQEKV